MPAAKYAFSFASLKFSNGRTAIDLSILRAEARGKTKKPAAKEMTSPAAASRIRLRRRCDGGACVCASTFEVRSIPDGVISKIQAKISAIGNPARIRTINRRWLQFGSSHAGKTAEAI